ncbi:MAG: PIG-L family deacetylase [Micropruina sp.]|nr:PIG-L family deacetylase [Micropruina sp.]
MTSLLDGVRSVLFAHAHPDDETLATGALIAWLSRRGVAVSVLTATRGERGEIVSGVVVDGDLDAHREAELAGALAALGVTRHGWLGSGPARVFGLPARRYCDSGMQWVTPSVAGPAADSGPDCLVAAPVAEAAADLAAYVRAVGAELVISYDSDGGYGHPDHVAMHHISRTAAELAGVPFAVVVSVPRDGSRASSESGVEWFDLAGELPAVIDALRCHASQLTVLGSDVIHSGGQLEPIQTRIGLRRG